MLLPNVHCGFPDSLMLHWRACRYCLAIGDSSLLFSCKTAQITWFFCPHWQPPWIPQEGGKGAATSQLWGTVRHLRLKPLHFFVILSGQVRFYRDDNWLSTSIPLAYSYCKQPWKVATAPLPTIPWPLYSIPSSISTLDELSSKRVNNWIPSGNQTWQWKNPLKMEVYTWKKHLLTVDFPLLCLITRGSPHTFGALSWWKIVLSHDNHGFNHVSTTSPKSLALCSLAKSASEKKSFLLRPSRKHAEDIRQVMLSLDILYIYMYIFNMN